MHKDNIFGIGMDKIEKASTGSKTDSHFFIADLDGTPIKPFAPKKDEQTVASPAPKEPPASKPISAPISDSKLKPVSDFGGTPVKQSVNIPVSKGGGMSDSPPFTKNASIDILQTLWPEWQIKKRIASGSYGTVYEAARVDHDVESHAAIKIISIPSNEAELDTLASEGFDYEASRTYLQGIVNDFVNEIRLMVSLEGSSNIVNVHDYKVYEKTDSLGWYIYIRMELLTPFDIYTCDRTLTEPEVIKLGCDICSALEICERSNIIHRDIKPGNILVHKTGAFKLGDFGIAKNLEGVNGGLSQRGTRNYMAPEVINGYKYDCRADIYSLGIVLYRLLNDNRMPFVSEKQIHNPNDVAAAVERRVRGEKLAAPCKASSDMAQIILTACAFNPCERFVSAAAMKHALISLANGTYASDSRAAVPESKSEDYEKTVRTRTAH